MYNTKYSELRVDNSSRKYERVGNNSTTVASRVATCTTYNVVLLVRAIVVLKYCTDFGDSAKHRAKFTQENFSPLLYCT
jgi:hypothetical protein